MTTTTQHTAASLAALHSRNPRELDAIAYEFVMGERLIDWAKVDDALVVYPNRIDYKNVPRYSTSLDAAALLETALAERGILLEHEYAQQLVRVLDASLIDYEGARDWYAISDVIRASAKSRTIAAVLAAQSQG